MDIDYHAVKSWVIYLKVWTGDTFGKLPEQGNHDLCELSRLYHIQDLFQLIQKHHLNQQAITFSMLSVKHARRHIIRLCAMANICKMSHNSSVGYGQHRQETRSFPICYWQQM